MTVPVRLERPLVDLVARAQRGAAPETPSDGPAFADLLSRTLGDTSRLQEGARGTIESFLRGDPVDLHQVVAASEEASISLELLVEIRNKLTDAYRTVMSIS